MIGRHDVIPLLAEVFRENGFSGTTLSRITAATGLGRGSLYHFFPGGKVEMAEAVLEEIAAWFHAHVFVPLRRAEDPAAAISIMFDAVDAYFESGQRICLIGAFASATLGTSSRIRFEATFEPGAATLPPPSSEPGTPDLMRSTRPITLSVEFKGR